MVTTLKRGAKKNRIKKLLEQLYKDVKPKGVDVYQFLGKIKLNEDALTIQKKLRNEWE